MTGEKGRAATAGGVLSVIIIFVALGTLNYLGTYAPWSPKMSAWSGDATRFKYIKGVRRSNCEARQAPPAGEKFSSATFAAFVAKSRVAFRFPPKNRTLPSILRSNNDLPA